MTYIKLEDVQKILSIISDKYQSEHTGGWITGKILEEIKSLSSINPEEMIQEMIEENRDEVYMEGKETSITRIEYELLQELLQKFKS